MSDAVWVRGADKNVKEKLVQLAKEDLARTLGIPAGSEAITVVSVTAVTWEDMSLGYPRPGRKVAPGYVPGYQIILGYGSREYDYHTGLGQVVYVPAGKGQAPFPTRTI